jgi:hypothetical protein
MITFSSNFLNKYPEMTNFILISRFSRPLMNMAGLLFLFLVQAMDESFKKQCALPKPEF